MTDLSLLSELSSPPFATRHIGPDDADQTRMLEAVGFASIADLIAVAVPEAIRFSDRLSLPPAASETEAIAELRALAERNSVLTSMIGLGYHDTITPGVIRRNVLENPGWYTAYTPYQPEISQGRLEALLNFQTVVSDLTGLDVAGASLLDEATAAAEAMTLARRASRGAANVFVVDADALPQTMAVLRTRAEPLGIELVESDFTGELPECFGVLVQYPGASGRVRDFRAIADAAHARGARWSPPPTCSPSPCSPRPASSAPTSRSAPPSASASRWLRRPARGLHGGSRGSAAPDARPPGRRLPGRRRRPAYRLALQTREQHIRREKATSNICTAQVLLAVIAGMYAVYHGPEGLRRIAAAPTGTPSCSPRASARAASRSCTTPSSTPCWPGCRAARPRSSPRPASAGINLRLVDADHVGITCDETTELIHLEQVLAAFGVNGAVLADLDSTAHDALPAALLRVSDYLTHPVFHSHRSETAMLRYLRRLQDKDIALDRSMIPLGSCTMKLNATTEMEPITWPEFAGLHPFAPEDQARGYLELIEELEGWLAEVTGYDAVSIQPNAGSQGEFAGLLAIRAYHKARGEASRDVCLIPSSAHGTNAASAVMAGMRVVVVACDDNGNVDLADLTAKIEKHRDRLAAIMVTYPSTHGVYEETIVEICELVHEAGGQVYVDGANLNALVGLAKLGEFGADVSHLNLHKTFCIPHGGGGPGVGPVAVRAHLAAYLPGHPLRERLRGRPGLGGAVRLGGHPADLLGVHPDDGRRRAQGGHRAGHPVGQLPGPQARARTTRSSTPAAAAWSPTSASSTCARSPRRPASPWTTWPSASSTTASTRRPCPSRWPAR